MHKIFCLNQKRKPIYTHCYIWITYSPTNTYKKGSKLKKKSKTLSNDSNGIFILKPITVRTIFHDRALAKYVFPKHQLMLEDAYAFDINESERFIFSSAFPLTREVNYILNETPFGKIVGTSKSDKCDKMLH